MENKYGKSDARLDHQEKLKNEFRKYGIIYCYTYENYGFIEFNEQYRDTVRRICRQCNVKSYNIINRMGKRYWRIHSVDSKKTRKFNACGIGDQSFEEKQTAINRSEDKNIPLLCKGDDDKTTTVESALALEENSGQSEIVKGSHYRSLVEAEEPVHLIISGNNTKVIKSRR